MVGKVRNMRKESGLSRSYPSTTGCLKEYEVCQQRIGVSPTLINNNVGHLKKLLFWLQAVDGAEPGPPRLESLKQDKRVQEFYYTLANDLDGLKMGAGLSPSSMKNELSAIK